MTTGVVLSVDVERFGDTLTAATLATDLVLHVDDVVDFADEDDFAAGPQWLTVGDSAPMQYVSVDDDNDTITLALAVGAVYEAGDPVRMWDAAAGAEVLSHVAWVELDEADADDQPIPAEVRPEEMIYFGLDDLAGLIGARVEIAEDEDEPGAWHVAHMIGRTPVLSGTYIAPGSLPAGTAGQTFSPDEPTVTDGFAEDHAWWQVVDGDVLGFWRLSGGAWLPQEVVTAEALRATNALIDALQTVDLSTVNLTAVNIDGGSIYIAQGVAASYVEPFSGTTFPAGWTATTTPSGGYVAPNASIIDTGYPSGGSGSVLVLDMGAAGQTAGGLTHIIEPDYEVADFELLMKYQFDIQGGGFFPPSSLSVDLCRSADGSDTYRLSLLASGGSVLEIVNGSQGTAVVSQTADGGWVDGAWYWVRLQKAAGSVSLAAWRDGETEPEPAVGQLSTTFPAGGVRIYAGASTFFGASDGQKFWIDQFDIVTHETGFKVNPDGTGEWPAIGLSAGDAAWRSVGDVGEPAYQNSWANAVGAQTRFRKSPTGDVTIIAERLTIPASAHGTAIFTLPEGYRPTIAYVNNYAWQNTNPRVALVSVGTDGVVKWENAANTGGTETIFTVQISTL